MHKFIYNFLHLGFGESQGVTTSAVMNVSEKASSYGNVCEVNQGAKLSWEMSVFMNVYDVVGVTLVFCSSTGHTPSVQTHP